MELGRQQLTLHRETQTKQQTIPQMPLVFGIWPSLEFRFWRSSRIPFWLVLTNWLRLPFSGINNTLFWSKCPFQHPRFFGFRRFNDFFSPPLPPSPNLKGNHGLPNWAVSGNSYSENPATQTKTTPWWFGLVPCESEESPPGNNNTHHPRRRTSHPPSPSPPNKNTRKKYIFSPS